MKRVSTNSDLPTTGFGETRALHAGRTANGAQQLRVDRDAVGIRREAAQGNMHAGGVKVIHIEPGVGMVEAVELAEENDPDSQQAERERDLTDYQNAQEVAAARAGGRADAVAQHLVGRDAHGLPERRETEQDAAQDGQSEGKQNGARIDGDLVPEGQNIRRRQDHHADEAITE